MKFEILGQIPSKKNNYRFGKGKFYNSKHKECCCCTLSFEDFEKALSNIRSFENFLKTFSAL